MKKQIIREDTGKFKKDLFGFNDNIFTFVIATPENPMGNKLSDKENADRRKEFEEFLKKHRLKYYKVNGQYGNVEHSYVVANINIDLCKYLFGKKKYDQESFIFGIKKVEEDKPLNYGESRPQRTYFCYYEQNNKGKFELIDKEESVKPQEDAEDFFSKYKGYKFSIPFSIFESAISEISDKLEEDYGWDPDYKKYCEHTALVEGKTLKHFWEYNCRHFLTKEQNDSRLERVKEAETFHEKWEKKYSDKVSLSEEIQKMMENK